MIKPRESLLEFVKEKKSELLTLAFTYIVLDAFSGIPYLSVVFNARVILGILFVLVIYLFKLNKQNLAAISICVLFLAIVSTLFNMPIFAEDMGNLLYALISLWLVFNLVEYFKSFKK